MVSFAHAVAKSSGTAARAPGSLLPPCFITSPFPSAVPTLSSSADKKTNAAVASPTHAATAPPPFLTFLFQEGGRI